MKNLLKIAAISLSLCLLACTDSENVNEQVQSPKSEIKMVNVGTAFEAPYMDIANMGKAQVLSLSDELLEVYLKNAFPIIKNSYEISSIVLNNEPQGSRMYQISLKHNIYITSYFENAVMLKSLLDNGENVSIEEMFEPLVDAYQVSAEYLKLLDEIELNEGV
tara:strand:+ start:570 stop:1058 length:489 start_codon:yes stop_codon:yes gene_type:complete